MSVTEKPVFVAPQNTSADFTESGMSRALIRDFLNGEADGVLLPEPNWGPIGKEVYERTYSRNLPIVNGAGNTVGHHRETWAETVRRVVNGSLSYVDPVHWQPDEDVDLFDLIYNFKAIPAGRHLWVTGTDVAHFSKNCWASGHVARTSAHFGFLAARLFEGGGVGSNYSADLLAATAPVIGALDVSFACHPDHKDYDKVSAAVGDTLDTETPCAPRRADGSAYYQGSLYAGTINAGVIKTATRMVVDDSREGWVDVWVRMIDLSTQPGHHSITIDVSNVRPYGTALKTFGGTASGPEALVIASIAIAGVLNGAAAEGRHLTGLEAMQIDHEIASAVVSGGSRRSARMSLMSWKDPQIFEFIHCKADPAMHWTTNISVEIDDDFHDALADPAHLLHDRAEEVLAEVAAGMARDGEPGMVDTSAHSADEPLPIRITNPCVTGDAWVQTIDGLRQVNDLVSQGKVTLLVNDEEWETTADGFFQTGIKQVVELDVDGTTLRLTPDHLVSTPDGWRPAGEILPGDVVDVTDSLGNTWGGSGNEAEGYLLGHLIGDGYFSPPNGNGVPGSANLCAWKSDAGPESTKAAVLQAIADAGLKHRADWIGWGPADPDRQHLHSAAIRDLAAKFGIVRHHKTVTDEVMAASSEFIAGFLRGLFDTDGHVEGSSTRGGVSVRLGQSDAEFMGKVRVLLLSLGIRSVVRDSAPAHYEDLPGGTYWCRDSYRLIISGAQVERFAKIVGFNDEVKAAKLAASTATMRSGFYVKSSVGTVRSVNVGATEPVFDCQVPGLHAFVANGTIIHNCSEASLQSHGSDQGIYGESCNLGSVDLAAFGTDTLGAHRAFELMARFLFRATLNPHSDPAASTIEATNRRIGVGIMGLQGWAAAHGYRLSELASSPDLAAMLTDFRFSVRLAANQFAAELGLPCPVKVTAVAPTGSIAQLGGTTPGIHPVYARHFVRRVRYQDADRALPELAAAGHTIVDDIYAANTKVVEFIMRDGILDQYPSALIEQADEFSVEDFFDLIAVVQRTFCGTWDGQAVSATAQIPLGSDPAELANQIRSRLGVMKGFTVFPATTRPLQPYEALSEEAYLQAAAAGLVAIAGDSNSGECVGGSCPIR